MSRTIDENVVQLSFDNSKFEGNVATSMKTLDNLKSSLKFDETGNGLEKAFSKVNFSPMTSGVDSVISKFVLLENTVGQVLSRITNQIIDIGEKLVSAVTVDPLRDGLKEYETQMGAIQTILSNTKSKGTTLEDVNKALDDLNHYADKTIYNFTQMTDNIGKFTAAGLDLETSTNSIKGIANLAAVSGSTSEQASRAMYQLSQALATGTVKLQDWNSVVNAGMGGEVFQKALERTSRAMGTGVDEALEKYGTFRESLTRGAWLTKDVLAETLKQISGAYDEADLRAQGFNEEQIKEILDLAEDAEKAATKVKTFTQLIDTLKEALGSGWTQTWEYIIGDFEKARDMWTGVSDVLNALIGASADARNNMLKDWSELGGRQSLILGLKYAFEALLSVVFTIKDAFEAIFPPITSTTLISLTAGFREFCETLYPTQEALQTIRGIAQGVFAVLKIAIDSIVTGFKMAYDAVSAFLEFSGLGAAASGLLDFLGQLGFLLSDIARFGTDTSLVQWRLQQMIQEFPLFGAAVDIVSTAFSVLRAAFVGIQTVASTVWEALKPLREAISSIFDKIGQFNGFASFHDFLMSIKEAADSFTDSILNANKGVGEFSEGSILNFGKILEFAKTAFGGVSKVFEGVINFVTNAFNFIKGMVDKIVAVVGPVFAQIKDAIGKAFEGAGLEAPDAKSAGIGLAGIITAITTALIFASKMAGPAFDFVNLLREIKNELMGGGSIFDSIKRGIAALTNGIHEIENALSEFKKSEQFKQLKSIAISIALIAGSLILLSMVDPKKLGNGLLAITGIMTELLGAFWGMQKIISHYNLDGKLFTMMAAALIVFAGSILVLAIAVRIMASADPVSLAVAIGGCLVLVASMLGTMYALQKLNILNITQGMENLIAFAAAILILSFAVKQLSDLGIEGLIEGLIGVGVLLFGISVFLKDSSTYGPVGFETGLAIIAIAAAMKILASAVKDFSQMDPIQMLQGLAAVFGLLIGFGAFSALIKGNADSMITAGIAMIFISAAMKILASAIGDFIALLGDGSNEALEKCAIGMGIFVASLILLTGALAALGAIGPAVLAGGAALLVAAAGVMILAKALQQMEQIGDVGKTLIILGTGLLMLSLALIAMSGAVAGAGALMLASVALLLLVPALLALSKLDLGAVLLGLLGAAAAITVLAVAAAALSATGILPLMAALSGVMLLFSLAIVGVGAGVMLVVGALMALQAALVMFANISGTVLQGAIENIGTVISSLFDMIIMLAPKFQEMMTTVTQTVIACMPMLGQMITSFILTLLTTINDTMPQVFETIGNFITQLITLISSKTPEFVNMIVIIVTNVLQAIATLAPEFYNTLSAIITELLNFIAEKVPEFANAALNIITGILTVLNTRLPTIMQLGTNLIVNFINGITVAIPRVIQAAFSLVIAFMNGIGDAFRNNGPIVGEAARNMFTGIIEGIIAAIIPAGAGVVQEFVNIVNKVLSKLGEFISDFEQAGIDFVTGLINGLGKKASELAEAARNIAQPVVDAVSSVFNSHSPSKVAEQQGVYYGEGLENGIDAKAGDVADAASEMAEGAIKASAEAFDENSPSKKTEQQGLDADNGAILGLEAGAGRVADAAGNVANGAVDKLSAGFSKAAPEVDKAIGGVTNVVTARGAEMLEAQGKTEEQSKAQTKSWVESQLDNLVHGQEEAKHVGEQVVLDTGETVTRLGEILEEHEDYTVEKVQMTFNGITSTMEKKIPKVKEKQDELVASGEKARAKASKGKAEFAAQDTEFWRTLYENRKNAAAGLDAENTTLADFEKDILEKTKNIVDGYKKVDQEARKMANDGLFKKVSEKTQVTSQELMDNLKGQINQINDYTNVMNSLNTRISSTALKEVINEMGVESLGELEALNSMTDEQLTEYTNLYDQKYAASLGQLKAKAQNELSNLYGGIPINIDAFAATFDGSLKSIEGYFTSEDTQAKLKTAGANVTKGVAEGVKDPEALSTLKEGAQAAADAVMTDESTGYVPEALQEQSPSELTKPAGRYITEGIAEGMKGEEAMLALQDAAAVVSEAILSALQMSNEEVGVSTQLMQFGKQFTQAIATAITNIDLQGQNFYLCGSTLAQKFCKGFDSQKSIATAKVNVMLTEIANAIKGTINLEKFKTAGTELFKGLVKGLEMGWFGAGGKGNEGGGGIGQKTLNKIIKKMINYIKKFKGDSESKGETFYWVGQQLIKGLIKGLEAEQGALYACIIKIVQTAIAKAQAAAVVHSPSKKTVEIGRYIGLGFVVGLKSMADAVYDASTGLSEEALSGFSSLANVLTNIEDFDATPVIAPVMDLTGIQNGISDMSGLLKNNNAYEISASLAGNIDTQRLAKLNEMTEMRRAMDSVYSSNTDRISEMMQLQSAVNQLNSLISSQTNPDYTSLQNSINQLNAAINNQRMPDYTGLQTSINGLNSTIGNTQTGNTLNVNPTFNIQSNDPEAVAEEVNIAIQNMIDRRSAVWGL